MSNAGIGCPLVFWSRLVEKKSKCGRPVWVRDASSHGFFPGEVDGFFGVVHRGGCIHPQTGKCMHVRKHAKKMLCHGRWSTSRGKGREIRRRRESEEVQDSVSACVRACECACVCECARSCVCVYVCARASDTFCSLARPQIEECSIDQHEAYAIDVVVSTGEGKCRELDTKCTVFKRAPDAKYNLRMKTAREALYKIEKSHPKMPFSLREIDDSRVRLGITECVRHELLQTHPVLYEREGEIVAQVKFCVLLMPSGALKITGGDIDESIKSDKVRRNFWFLGLFFFIPGIQGGMGVGVWGVFLGVGAGAHTHISCTTGARNTNDAGCQKRVCLRARAHTHTHTHTHTKEWVRK
jgi:hypothetical protein